MEEKKMKRRRKDDEEKEEKKLKRFYFLEKEKKKGKEPERPALEGINRRGFRRDISSNRHTEKKVNLHLPITDGYE
jgi:hypothetical protein